MKQIALAIGCTRTPNTSLRYVFAAWCLALHRQQPTIAHLPQRIRTSRPAEPDKPPANPNGSSVLPGRNSRRGPASLCPSRVPSCLITGRATTRSGKKTKEDPNSEEKPALHQRLEEHPVPRRRMATSFRLAATGQGACAREGPLGAGNPCACAAGWSVVTASVGRRSCGTIAGWRALIDLSLLHAKRLTSGRPALQSSW